MARFEAINTHQQCPANTQELHHAGTTSFVDPAQDFFALMMIQARNQRDYHRPLFRNLVDAALDC